MPLAQARIRLGFISECSEVECVGTSLLQKCMFQTLLGFFRCMNLLAGITQTAALGIVELTAGGGGKGKEYDLIIM